MTTQNTTTIFDDVFRTMLEKMPELVIPVINEVFETSYEKTEKIWQSKNEHLTPNGKIITDSCLYIQDKIYHLECQSQDDSTMVIRMIEYDFAIALNNIKFKNGIYEMEFPRSCVIFLRKYNPEHLHMRIHFQDGFSHTYQVPAINIQDYTKDEIFEKHLFMFLPYYIMKYEKEYDKIEKDETKLTYFLKELADIQKKIQLVFKQEEKSSYYRYMIELITQIANHMLRNKKTLKERIGDIMGGKVLELETDRIIAESKAKGFAEGKAEGMEKGMAEGRIKGRMEGRMEGRIEGRIEGKMEGKIEGKMEGKMEIITAFLKSGMSCEELAARLDMSIEEIRKIEHSL